MSRGPYVASEDSALIRGALRGLSGSSCLEIGAGNAGNLIELSKDFGTAVGTDIVRPGMTDWGAAGADYVLSDRASCFKDGTFDLVVLNPPYLRSDDIDDPAVDGGRGEVPLGFFREALRAVRHFGKVVMLLNEECPLREFEAECDREGFVMRRIAARHLFYEELTVYEAEARR